ncbi:hypothetical protein D3C77_525680 [compost metagenome]
MNHLEYPVFLHALAVLLTDQMVGRKYYIHFGYTVNLLYLLHCAPAQFLHLKRFFELAHHSLYGNLFSKFPHALIIDPMLSEVAHGLV